MQNILLKCVLINQTHFSIEGIYRSSTTDVELRGTFLKGKRSDLPTLIWFSDLVEPAENFKPFFTRPDSKILDVRNVWLLNYRNMGDSDHHDSFDMGVSIYGHQCRDKIFGYISMTE